MLKKLNGVQARSQPLAKRKNSLIERKGKLIGLKRSSKSPKGNHLLEDWKTTVEWSVLVENNAEGRR